MTHKVSTHWKSSSKPRKQRSFRYRAPLHERAAFVHAHVSKDLKAKYGIRSLQLRTGDKVKVMRGGFKKQEGKVESVDLKKGTVLVEKIERTKKEGAIVKIPLQPSNLLIIDLNTDDKRRIDKLRARHPSPKPGAQASAPPASATSRRT